MSVTCDRCGCATEVPVVAKKDSVYLCEECAKFCEDCDGTGKLKDGSECRWCGGTGLKLVEDDYFGW